MRVRVVDGDYIMGYLHPCYRVSFVLDWSVPTGVTVENRWGDSTNAPYVSMGNWYEIDPSKRVPILGDENGVRYYPCAKLGTRQICIAARVDEGEEDVCYVVFPDFRISGEKLGPIVQSLYKSGVREIEYSTLRRLLDM